MDITQNKREVSHTSAHIAALQDQTIVMCQQEVSLASYMREEMQNLYT